MHDALALAEHGQEQPALQLLEALLGDDPDFAPALKLQGMLLEDTGNSRQAGASYTKALKLSPGDPELQLKVGVFDLVEGRNDQATELLSKHAALKPKDSEGFYYLAQAYHRGGNDPQALKAIRRALELDPASAPIAQKYGELLCSSGDNTEAMRWLKRALQADPTLPRINFDLAVASYNNMALEDAVNFSKRETASAPSNEDNLALLASAQIKLAHWTDAMPTLHRALETRPEDPALLLELGYCQLELKLYQPAYESLTRSLQLDPTQVRAHFLLSRTLGALGRPTDAQHEAELHQEMMQQISFALPKDQLKLQKEREEKARILLSDHHEPEALAVFASTTAGPSGTAGSPYVALGAVYLSMTNTEAAHNLFQKALRLDAKTRGANTYLGIMALQAGDLAEAEHDFQAELSIDPNHPLALAELGEVRYRQGQFDQAVRQLIASKTTIPALLYMLTDSQFRLGKTAAATLTAESLAAYAHNQPQMLTALADLLARNGQRQLAQRLTSRPLP